MTASYGQIGALNAESYCERPSASSDAPGTIVLTEGNTLLKDEDLEMLVILRMNRDFMKFMRELYNYLTKQTFGRTVVDPDLE